MIDDRIMKDSQGRQFIPMNVEGGAGESNFFNTTKILLIAFWVVGIVLYIANVPKNEGLTLLGKIVVSLIFLFIWYKYLTLLIFEERYYYKMYKKLKAYSNPDTSTYWRVASIKNTSTGGIMLYADGKVGVIIKLDRGSILGREEDFAQRHFEAISDFFRDITSKGYSFVHLNTLEEASSDPRLANIEHLISLETNENIKEVLELQAGTIKRAMRATLYESDYILVYDKNIEGIDNILYDVSGCAFTLLDGCYTGYTILGSKEIIALHKELNGISYFDFTDASINVFRDMENIGERSVLKIKRLKLKNGRTVELNDKDIKLLKQAINNLQNSDNGIEVSIAKILGKKDMEESKKESTDTWGVSLESFKDIAVRDNQKKPGIKLSGNRVTKNTRDDREKPDLKKEMTLKPKQTSLTDNKFNDTINKNDSLVSYSSDDALSEALDAELDATENNGDSSSKKNMYMDDDFEI